MDAKITKIPGKCDNCEGDSDVVRIEVANTSVDLCMNCRRDLISELQSVTDEEQEYEDFCDA